MEDKADNIYKMMLHEVIVFDNCCDQVQIMRVPGGWIYTKLGSSVFVPFDTGFLNA